MPPAKRQDKKADDGKKEKRTPKKNEKRKWSQSIWEGITLSKIKKLDKHGFLDLKIHPRDWKVEKAATTVALIPGPKNRPYIFIDYKKNNQVFRTSRGIYHGFERRSLMNQAMRDDLPKGTENSTFMITYQTTGYHHGESSTYKGREFVHVEGDSKADELQAMLEKVDALIKKGETGGGNAIRDIYDLTKVLYGRSKPKVTSRAG